MCGKKKRWTNQKSSSPKDGMNPQAELMDKWFSSYSTHFLAYGRGISCTRSTGVFFGKVRVKMDNMKLQKSVPIEWWTKFLFSPKNHLSVSDLTVKMMIDLISSASNFCFVFGICGYLVKISEIGLDSRRNETSVVLTPTVSESATLSRPCAADSVYRCAQTAEVNLWARASPCWKHLACRQRKIDGRGKLLFTDSTDRKDSCRRANGKTDEEVDPLCKVVDHAEILEIGEFLACQKQRWNAQNTLRRNSNQPSLKVDDNFEEPVPEAELGRSQISFQQGRKLRHWCEGAKHEQPWDIDLGKISVQKKFKIVVRLRQSTVSFWQKIKTMRRQQAHKVSHLMARGNLEHLPIHQGSWAVVPCPRGLPGETTRKTHWLTRHERKRDSDGALFWREHGMSVQKKKKGRTWSEDWQRVRLLENSPVKQRKCEILGKKSRVWQACNSIKKIIPNLQREEPVYIGARQCHSREPGYVNVSRRKIEKRYATLLYHIGFSKNEDSLKYGGLLPGGLGTSRCRK